MRAFHGDPAIKAFYLDRVTRHIEARQVRRGIWWSGKAGCAVGVTVHSGSPRDYELQLGIPAALAGVEVTLFEALPRRRAMAWPLEFLQAIGVGAQLAVAEANLRQWIEDEYRGHMLSSADSAWANAIPSLRCANLASDAFAFAWQEHGPRAARALATTIADETLRFLQRAPIAVAAGASRCGHGNSTAQFIRLRPDMGARVALRHRAAAV
jgi:hypothetical protein